MGKLDKKTLWAIFAVIIIAVVLLAVALKFNKINENPLASTLASQTQVSEFTINGEVIKIESNQLIIRMGIVTKTPSGNQVVYEERAVSVTNDTRVIKAVKEGAQGFITTPIKLSDIPANSKVTAHVTGNPLGKAELVAKQIDYLPD